MHAQAVRQQKKKNPKNRSKWDDAKSRHRNTYTNRIEYMWYQMDDYSKIIWFFNGIHEEYMAVFFVSRFSIGSELSVASVFGVVCIVYHFVSLFFGFLFDPVFIPCGMIFFAYHVLCALFSNGNISSGRHSFSSSFFILFVRLNSVCSMLWLNHGTKQNVSMKEATLKEI